MRTEAIEEHIWAYSGRIEKKLKNLSDRCRETAVGDAILLAASVVYFAPFAPEEREIMRMNLKKTIE